MKLFVSKCRYFNVPYVTVFHLKNFLQIFIL
jgi:hypothetical protein